LKISYRVQKLNVTKLVDTDSQAVLDVHCSTNREGSDADLAEQIARRNAGDLRSLAVDACFRQEITFDRFVPVFGLPAAAVAPTEGPSSVCQTVIQQLQPQVESLFDAPKNSSTFDES